jgi:hypothetical protein
MSYGTTEVGTSATSLFTNPTSNSAPLVKNQGPATVYIGDSTVTADQASTGGLPLAPGEKANLPSVPGGGTAEDVYGITAQGEAYVSFFYI